MELTLQKLFEDAYEVLAPDQIALAKREYGSAERGQFCAIGALRQAAFGRTHLVDLDWGTEAENPYWRAYRMLGEHLGVASIPPWNDAPERTKDDVLALFRELAAETAVAE
jgi:hypothetical protein